MKRSAKAIWTGNLKHGRGMMDTDSGALTNQIYSFAKRFGDEPGANPEELIAAAHAGCFSMALAGELEKKGFVPDSITTKAEVNLENVVGDWSINSVHFKVIANVPEASEEIIKQCANSAKENCPVSKLLNTDITMELKIISQESNLNMNA